MADLPKRGDRVRVTEFRADRGRKFPLTNPVELTGDARDVGDGFVSFPALTPKGAPTELHAVKVEILERAGDSCKQPRVDQSTLESESFVSLFYNRHSGAVLERAGEGTACCPACYRGDQGERCDVCGGAGRIAIPADLFADFISDEDGAPRSKSEPNQVHPEFARGMRRAVEIAEERAQATWLFRDVVSPFVSELKEAVEKELKP